MTEEAASVALGLVKTDLPGVLAALSNEVSGAVISLRLPVSNGAGLAPVQISSSASLAGTPEIDQNDSGYQLRIKIKKPGELPKTFENFIHAKDVSAALRKNLSPLYGALDACPDAVGFLEENDTSLQSASLARELDGTTSTPPSNTVPSTAAKPKKRKGL